MKNSIPISQLDEELSGIRLDRINDAYVNAIFDKIGEAHRNDHYIAVLLTTGSAELMVDFKKQNLRSMTLLLLYPDQVKSVVSFEDSEGWVLFFNSSLVNQRMGMALEENFYEASIFNLSVVQNKWFHDAFTLLYSTIKSDEIPLYRQSMSESVLSACLYKIASIYYARVQIEKEHYSVRKFEITKAFRRLLSLNYKTKKSPGQYAAMMNISLGYLNDTIKSVTGKNVSTNIQQATIIEAQRLLYHSTMSIKEVAAKVGYMDPQHFSRIFTKISQQSPGKFRKKYDWSKE
ncbi:MAG: helix-turn-helix transcriptional regulator [Sediminicola sp.]